MTVSRIQKLIIDNDEMSRTVQEIAALDMITRHQSVAWWGVLLWSATRKRDMLHSTRIHLITTDRFRFSICLTRMPDNVLVRGAPPA
jgi:hypothetical protein